MRGVEPVLEEFDEYLALQRGRSAHTRRAYLGDLRSLFDFLAEQRPTGSEQADPAEAAVLAGGSGRRRRGAYHAGPAHLGDQDLHRVGAAPRPAATIPPRGCRCPKPTARCLRCCARIRRSMPWTPPIRVRSKVIRSRCATG